MKYQAGNLDNDALDLIAAPVHPKDFRNDAVFSSRDGYRDPIISVPSENAWLCLFTQPHREKLAHGTLSELGFHVYLPLRRKLVLRKGKRVPMTVPLFSRYLFIKANKDDAYLFSAHRQSGVTGFAAKSFSQSFISGSVIDEIKARECPDGFVRLKSNSIKPGQKVTIVDSPFDAIDAIFSEAKDERRSILLLSLLGKTHRVVVSNENLQLVY